LLAGRKLLLADDSITIQKVVDLTFADEGVSVVCVNNGREAVERLEQFAPDVVLADVFMPQMNGYQVCEYIKQNERFKHIPVMLLVGSFEPFDEEEARRVGANDILTKPFQSIRRLIEKVGLLTSSRPPEEQIPTAELPKPEVTPEPEVEKLSTAELEMTTADTQPLPAELHHVVEQAASSMAKQRASDLTSRASMDFGIRESNGMETRSDLPEGYEGSGEVLLDLGEIDSGTSGPDEEFVLDIDLDEVPEPSPVEPAFSASAFRNRKSVASEGQRASETSWSLLTPVSETPAATTGQLAPAQEFQRVTDDPSGGAGSEVGAIEARPAEMSKEQGGISAVAAERYSPSTSAEGSSQQLSPEMIDAIARRAVERLSEKVVQEIAWEVVPQLAELLIKRQLEEKSS
jgi:CheY-like chemotaxis protein